jgi:hypothetical protein
MHASPFLRVRNVKLKRRPYYFHHGCLSACNNSGTNERFSLNLILGSHATVYWHIPVMLNQTTITETLIEFLGSSHNLKNVRCTDLD